MSIRHLGGLAAFSALVLTHTVSSAAVTRPIPFAPINLSEAPLHTEGEILVRYRATARASAIQVLHAEMGAQSRLLSSALHAERVFFNNSISVDEMVERYEASPLVEFAHPNYIATIAYKPNDPYFVDSGIYHGSAVTIDAYHLHPVDAERGWDAATGKGVVIAHIDSGVDFDHPELEGQMWVNSDEIANNGRDDDNNGFKDDVHGMDFVGDNIGLMREILFPRLYDTLDGNPDVHELGNDGWGIPDPSIGNGVDDNLDGYADIGASHGTMTAGVMISAINDSEGLPGVSPQAKLMVLRAINPEGMGLISDMIASIDYAVDNGADIINMSLGLGADARLFSEAIQRAFSQGVAVIAASGNSGTKNSSAGVAFPANLPQTFAVGAGSASFARAEYSDYGPELDVIAPGGAVVLDSGEFTEVFWTTWVATVADEDAGFAPAGTPGWAGSAGTSMAAPVVSSLAALYLELNPSATPTEVYKALRACAVDVGPEGHDNETGYGMVNARRLTGQTLGRVTGYISPATQHIQPGENFASNVVITNNDTEAHTIRAEVNVYDNGRLVPMSPIDFGTLTLAAGQQLRASLPHSTPNNGELQGTYFIELDLYEDGELIDYDDFALNFRRKRF